MGKPEEEKHPTEVGQFPQQQLADRISSRGCKQLGKGPSHCKVSVLGDEVTVKVFGFLTQMEEALIRAGDRDFVVELRRHVLKATMPQWQEDFASVGFRVVSVSSSIDLEHNVRTLVFKVGKA